MSVTNRLLVVLLLGQFVALITGCDGSTRSQKNAAAEQTLEIGELLELPEEEQLGERVQVGDYSIHSPRGMAKGLADPPKDFPKGAEWHTWGGISNLTSGAGLAVMVIPLPDDLPSYARSSGALKKMTEQSMPGFRNELILSSTSQMSIVNFHGKDAVRVEFVGFAKDLTVGRAMIVTFFDGDSLIMLAAFGGGDKCDDVCKAMARCAVTLKGGGLNESVGYSPKIMSLHQPREDSAVGKLKSLIAEHQPHRIMLVNCDFFGIHDNEVENEALATIPDHFAQIYPGVEVMELPSTRYENLMAVAPVDDREDFVARLDLGRFAGPPSTRQPVVRLHMDDDFVEQKLLKLSRSFGGDTDPLSRLSRNDGFDDFPSSGPPKAETRSERRSKAFLDAMKNGDEHAFEDYVREEMEEMTKEQDSEVQETVEETIRNGGQLTVFPNGRLEIGWKSGTRYSSTSHSGYDATQLLAGLADDDGVKRIDNEDGSTTYDFPKRDMLDSANSNGAGATTAAANDYRALGKLLTEGSTFDQEKAAKKLIAADPSEVSDAETRKLIARGFRTMAMDGRFHQDLAVRGLVRWGGKFSTPIIIQLMDRETINIDDHLFDALATLKDPRGAVATARHLGNFFNHDSAVATLRRMGPVAEPALMKVAPSNDAKASLAAVELLGEVGSPESYDLLRQAMKSKNRQVRDVAKASLKAIRDREREREKEE